MNTTVLIIDDEEQLRKLLARIISLEGFTVLEAGSLKSGLQLLQHQPAEVILCDVRLPDGNGVEFVKTLQLQYPSTAVILLTAYGNIPDSVQAIKNGAFDYIIKGDDNDRIIPLLHQAVAQVEQQKRTAITIDAKTGFDFSAIVGKSPAVLRAIDLAKRIAVSDSTVLLLGETGTGKEIFAHAIHRNSKRKQQSIVAINCSAFSRELLEGELFGHKAGAYTGATRDKKGLIEMADGGTLFLDEIGELPIDLQAKLLRLLENGEYIKLGDTKVSIANARIIAATNRDLPSEIDKGLFREDLYYRINVFTIQLPSLRERQEDIPALANFFLQQFLHKEKRELVTISSPAMQLLQDHTWKGNTRELKNIIHRAAILAEKNSINPEQLPYEIQQGGTTLPNGLSLAAIEKMHIQKILQHTGGNKTKAAGLLEIGLATLYRKMEEYAIHPGKSK